MVKKILLLSTAICAAISLFMFQPAYAQVSEFKLTVSDGAADDHFGFSISTSGDQLLAGAHQNSGSVKGLGKAYMFNGII